MKNKVGGLTTHCHWDGRPPTEEVRSGCTIPKRLWGPPLSCLGVVTPPLSHFVATPGLLQRWSRPQLLWGGQLLGWSTTYFISDFFFFFNMSLKK
jgi:hypothetical protein